MCFLSRQVSYAERAHVRAPISGRPGKARVLGAISKLESQQRTNPPGHLFAAQDAREVPTGPTPGDHHHLASRPPCARVSLPSASARRFPGTRAHWCRARRPLARAPRAGSARRRPARSRCRVCARNAAAAAAIAIASPTPERATARARHAPIARALRRRARAASARDAAPALARRATARARHAPIARALRRRARAASARDAAPRLRGARVRAGVGSARPRRPAPVARPGPPREPPPAQPWPFRAGGLPACSTRTPPRREGGDDKKTLRREVAATVPEFFFLEYRSFSYLG